jgi:hypothetical protein
MGAFAEPAQGRLAAFIRRKKNASWEGTTMRTRRLLLLALLPLCFSAYADPRDKSDRDDGPRGVPFDRLQKQIDQLRQRIDALEAASPAGQSCPSGQFVTGFSSAGAILCATANGGGTPTPPPAPGPVPQAVLDALQQAILALGGQEIPLQGTPVTSGVPGLIDITTVPRTYGLTIGGITFSQPNAASLAIQVLVPSFSLLGDVTVTSSLLGNGSGTLLLTATNMVVNVILRIDDRPAGMRRLGAVTSVAVSPGTLSVTGTLGNAALDNAVRQQLSASGTLIVNTAEQGVSDAITRVLPTLPDF